MANSLDGTVSRVDPLTNRQVQAVPVGVTPTAVAVADGVVWVTSAEERSVTKIDVVRGRMAGRIPTDALGRGIAVGGGSNWVTDGSSRGVVRIDARRAATGVVWVSVEFSEEIARIDPDENVVVERVPVATRPKGLVISANRVWFAVQTSGVRHRGGRLVVAGHGLISGSIDPSFWQWAGTFPRSAPPTTDSWAMHAAAGARARRSCRTSPCHFP